MKTLLKFSLGMVLGAILLLSVGGGLAQGQAVQVIDGAVSPDQPIALYTVTLSAADTLYAYAGSTEFDPFLAICADDQCSSVLAQNDDIDLAGGNFNSALEFAPGQDTTVYVGVRDCCNAAAAGAFQLALGLNAPEALSGTAAAAGAPFAVPFGQVAPPPPGQEGQPAGQVGLPPNPVQEFTFNVNTDTPRRYYDLFGLNAGDTIYIYVESASLDTYLVLCDINCEEIFAENDDIDFGAGNTNSALEFTLQQGGDYSILVTDCCNEAPDGEFRIQIGINAPEVLTGTATPNTDRLAELWRPTPVVVQDLERPEPVNCDNAMPQERPMLSGPVQNLETSNFLLHYTTEGEDAVRPEFAQQVQATLEDMTAIQVAQGWPLPPSDCGEGGDTRFDIYMEETIGETGAVGYASPGNIVTDNPNTPDFQETWAAYSYLVLDNDFSFSSDPSALMRATTAHEYHHTVQFGYDFNDAISWYYEATATWMEIQTYPEDEDATPYTPDILATMDWCIGSSPPERLRVYAEWTLIDSLAQDHGPESILRLWQLIADFEGMDSYYNLLSEVGSTPQAAQLNLAVRNLLRDFALGNEIQGTVRTEGNVNGLGQVVPRQDGVQELGVDYVYVAQPGNYTITADQPNLAVFVVGIDQPGGAVQVFDVSDGSAVDTTAFGRAYVLVLNTAQHDNPDACTFTDWSLTVADGAGAPAASPLPLQFNPANFVPAG